MSDIRLSGAIMAHPKREAMVKDLLVRLDRKIEVVWDRHNDRHDTGERSLMAYDSDCDYHMVLQDDALPCANLMAGIERALEYVPEGHPLVGYIGRVAPFAENIDNLVRRNPRLTWITMAGIYWGPCIVVPTAIIPELLEHYRSDTIPNYDRRVSRFFESKDLDAWYPWPSLVEHRNSKSLAHPTTGRRNAHSFVKQDALKMNWSSKAIKLQNTRAMDNKRQSDAINPPSSRPTSRLR